LGNIHNVFTEFTWQVDLESANIRLNKDLEPLGSLGDLGWYCLRAILFVYKNELPKKVMASQQLLKGNGVPFTFTGTLWFSGERSASFYCSFNDKTQQCIHITGSEASLHIDDFVIPWKSSPAYFPMNTLDLKASLLQPKSMEEN